MCSLTFIKIAVHIICETEWKEGETSETDGGKLCCFQPLTFQSEDDELAISMLLKHIFQC